MKGYNFGSGTSSYIPCFSLAKANSIYGSSTTVTPLSLGTTFYIKYL